VSYLGNVRLERTVVCTGEKCFEKFSNVESGFYRTDNWNNAYFILVFEVQKL
jgi:hypothetical protein